MLLDLLFHLEPFPQDNLPTSSPVVHYTRENYALIHVQNVSCNFRGESFHLVLPSKFHKIPAAGWAGALSSRSAFISIPRIPIGLT